MYNSWNKNIAHIPQQCELSLQSGEDLRYVMEQNIKRIHFLFPQTVLS